MTIRLPAIPAGLEELLPAFIAEMAKDSAMLAELVDGDRIALAEHVHAMRGKCAMFGEEELFQRLSALELECASLSREQLHTHLGGIVARCNQLSDYAASL